MAIAWHDAQRLLASELAEWLGTVLPSHGGHQYWERYVLGTLSVAQRRECSTVDPGDFGSLDFAALIRVAIANCDELAANQLVSEDVKPNLELLKNARNTLSHLTSSGISARKELRLLEPGLHLLEALERDTASIDEFEDLLEHLRKQAGERMTERPEDQTTTPDPTKPKNSGEISPWPFPSGPNLPINAKSFLGLDFGTSTSVVSLIVPGPEDKLSIAPLSLDQPEENGGTTRYHLINTVLAHVDGKVLFGRDAYRLRPFLRNEIDVFASFKMLLGLDIGPDYPLTSLRRDKTEEPVESAKDAATLFFRKLKVAITDALDREGRPTNWAIAVTVPASFEANQRRDLRDCLSDAGIDGFVGFIDEPNAAFLSHLFRTSLRGEGLAQEIRQRPFTVCVYDIGAGTCDVSILDISEENGFPVSRNRAISRFTALGGDDLDRLIARDVLWPQLQRSYPDFDPSEGDIEQRIIPRLMPTAEMLKITATNRLRDNDARSLDDCQDGDPISARPVKPFDERDRNGKKHRLQLGRPKISLSDFAKAIKPMLSATAGAENGKHVYAPVANALAKAEIKPRDIDAVLFIGGTALNPLIRHAIMARFPEGTRAIVPRDLQTHVSMGAAIHAYALDQHCIDMIAPITPEAIYVLARGGGLEPVIRAGTVVPMGDTEIRFLTIDRDGQDVVELPFCVGSEDKMLGTLQIQSDRPGGFPRGSEVRVCAQVTRDKLLEVTAEVDGRVIKCAFMKPITNDDEPRPQDYGFHKARQEFNRELLEHHGCPSPETVHIYALAALEAHEYSLAADLFQKLERLDPSRDNAVNISYAYACAGMRRLSKEWTIRALERNPNHVTALYNRSLDLGPDEAIPLLRKALKLRSDYRPVRIRLGQLLRQREDPKGMSMLNDVMREMSRALDAHELNARDCLSLVNLARDLGGSYLANRAEARASTLREVGGRGIDEGNLADILQPVARLETA